MTPPHGVTADPAGKGDGEEVDALWWHALGGVLEGAAETEDGEPADAYVLQIVGESTIAPDDLPPSVHEPRPMEHFGCTGTLAYLGSFDHDPTDAEREALKPEEYRD